MAREEIVSNASEQLILVDDHGDQIRVETGLPAAQCACEPHGRPSAGAVSRRLRSRRQRPLEVREAALHGLELRAGALEDGTLDVELLTAHELHALDAGLQQR